MSSFSLQHLIHHLPGQDNIGCCTSSASLLAAEMMLATQNKHLRFSRLFVYYMTRRNQNRIHEKGADLSETLRAMKMYGACMDNTWPFRFNRVNIEPHMNAITEASQYKVDEYRAVQLDEFKDLLHSKLPIIIGMNTGRKFWKLKGPLKEQNYCPINLTDNRHSLGHAITVVGYDDNMNGGSWIIGNSLGLTWGERGLGAIPYTCSADMCEAYVITSFAGMAPDKNFRE